MNKTCYVIIVVLLCIIGYLCWNNHTKNSVEYITITTTDTLYVERIIKDTVPILKYKYVDRYITDTLMTVDSIYVPVNIPISNYHYSNTLFNNNDTIKYSAYLSGYKTTLDSIDISVRYPQIIKNTTIKTVNKGGITYGLGVGFGYGVFTKKPDIFIGGYVGWKFK